MGRVERGLHLTGASWSVVKHQPRVLVLPLTSIALNVMIGGLSVALVRSVWFDDLSRRTFVVAGAVTAFPLAFTSIFLQVAFLAMLAGRLEGEETTVRDGLRAARRRASVIVGWALVSATVGVVLRLLEEIKFGWLAVRIAVWLTDAAWSLVTFLIVPVLAFEGRGVRSSLRRSAGLFRETWGENVTGRLSIGVVSGLASLPGAVLLCVGVAGWDGLPRSTAAGLIAGGAVWVMSVAVVASALSQTLGLGLYRYAAGVELGPFQALGGLASGAGPTWSVFDEALRAAQAPGRSRDGSTWPGEVPGRVFRPF